MNKAVISIVIPNWNGVYLMKKHLQKVMDVSPKAEIIIADDMSTDGSVEFLQKNFPHVTVVVGKERKGFAVNVNRGVARATGEIIILLNTDVEPEEGYLEPLTKHFADPTVFAVGCLEKSWEHGQSILRGRGIGHWQKGFYIHSRGEINKTDTAWVSGGSGAFRKSMWNRLNGMDIIYSPFYWEDIDLSYRARKAGWKALFEAKSIVNHYHEEGKIKREFTASEVKRIVYRNQFLFIWKNLSGGQEFVRHITWLPIRIIQAFAKGDMLMAQGFFWALLFIPTIIKRRIAQSKLWNGTDASLNMYS